MLTMTGWLRDRWRGYSNADLESVKAKLAGPESRRLDGIIAVSRGEMLALNADRSNKYAA